MIKEIKYNTLVKDNFDLFNKEILPYYFLLYTTTGKIILIEPEKTNFSHLIGINYSSHPLLKSFNAASVYNYFDENIKSGNLFDFINQDRFNNDELTSDEIIVYNKNISFQIIFNEFLKFASSAKKIHRKIHLATKSTNEADADYYFIHNFGVKKGYLGIVGDSTDKFKFRFNSIMYRSDNKIQTVNYTLSHITRILKTDLKIGELIKNDQLIQSNRYQMKTNEMLKNKDKNKLLDFKKNANAINAILKGEFRIKVSKGKKPTVKVYNSNDLEINHEMDLKNAGNTLEEVAQYILNNSSNWEQVKWEKDFNKIKKSMKSEYRFNNYQEINKEIGTLFCDYEYDVQYPESFDSSSQFEIKIYIIAPNAQIYTCSMIVKLKRHC